MQVSLYACQTSYTDDGSGGGVVVMIMIIMIMINISATNGGAWLGVRWLTDRRGERERWTEKKSRREGDSSFGD